MLKIKTSLIKEQIEAEIKTLKQIILDKDRYIIARLKRSNEEIVAKAESNLAIKLFNQQCDRCDKLKTNS